MRTSCPSCGGHGVIKHAPPRNPTQEICRVCNGTGVNRDLRGADLRNVDLSDLDLTGVDVTNALLVSTPVIWKGAAL